MVRGCHEPGNPNCSVRPRDGKTQHSTAKQGNGSNSAHYPLTVSTSVSEGGPASPSGDAKREKEIDMRPKLMLCSAAILVAALYHAGSVLATPANPAFKATTIATGTFGEIDVFNQFPKNLLPAGFDGDVWLSLQKTKGPSDLYVQSNVWQPVNLTTGVVASTGWHTHPGHSLIIVTSGTLTEYDADCTPHVYTFVPGQPAPTLVDPGRDHVHIIRNEGSVVASSIAVQLVPNDPNKANRRIDAPAPENCSSIN
jgi:hypothetical protein